jgi:nucleoside-diphosphate-sugar epimerase
VHARGWHHRTALAEGIASTYRWFLEHRASAQPFVTLT